VLRDRVLSDRRVVPCNGCVACCRTQKAILHPQYGDDVASYQAVETTMADGRPEVMLARKDNGECVYLGEKGCTIHNRAPWVCRRFDCRKLVLGFGDSAIMREVWNYLDHDVVRAGIERLGSFTPESAKLPESKLGR
jgi:uncharacterized protein